MEPCTLPRKTNYDFERRERERNKEAESARKAKAKAEKKASEQGAPDVTETGDA
jgi:3'-phosphoadenosine 5'-phosphosulfate sulfotransferase (PAPS reductase)/FAD synthetase